MDDTGPVLLEAVVAELAAEPPAPPAAVTVEEEHPRSAIKRNLLWLQWAEEIGMDAKNVFGQVRDRWNNSSAEVRADCKPHHAKIQNGKPGHDRVRKGIEAAQNWKRERAER
jgi:hypothetical protein